MWVLLPTFIERTWHWSVLETSPSLWLGLMLPNLFLGLCLGISFAGLIGAIMRDVPPSRYASAGAGRTTAHQLAQPVGVAVAVAVIGRPDDTADLLTRYRVRWLLGAAAMGGLALFFVCRYPERRPVAPSRRRRRKRADHRLADG